VPELKGELLRGNRFAEKSGVGALSAGKFLNYEPCSRESEEMGRKSRKNKKSCSTYF